MSGLQKAQEEVKEVTEIMMENLNKAEERDEKLSDMEDRAEELKRMGSVFEKTTKIVMEQKKEEYVRKKCMKKPLLGVILGAVALAILIGLVVFMVG